MPNLYAQVEHRERVTQDVVDLAVHDNRIWGLDLLCVLMGALFWWR